MKKIIFCAPVKKQCVSQLSQGDLGSVPQNPQSSPGPDLNEPHSRVPSRNKDSGQKMGLKVPQKPVSNYMMFLNEK